MINNSYKALMDVVNDFTIAAGAAQRVMTLMDSLPDIQVQAVCLYVAHVLHITLTRVHVFLHCRSHVTRFMSFYFLVLHLTLACFVLESCRWALENQLAIRRASWSCVK